MKARESSAPGGPSNKGELSRRRFLSRLALAAAAGTGLTLTTFGSAAGKEGPRWGLLIDPDQCASGCDACVTGCDEEHGLREQNGPRTDARWIRKVTLKHRQTGKVTSLPLMCQHCANPPCVDVCPTGASFKRSDGIVLVDKHICIGCRYCMMACPFKARSFIHEDLTDQKTIAPRGKGTVESCTLCVHRVDAGGTTTACADACSAAGHQAILFGDLHDPQSEISRRLASAPSVALRADLGLDAGVRYTTL